MTDLLNYSNELPFLVPTKLSLMLCLCLFLRSFVRMLACGCLPSNTSSCSSCFVRRIYRSYSLCRPICNTCVVRFLRHICFLSCSVGRCCSCICMLCECHVCRVCCLIYDCGFVFVAFSRLRCNYSCFHTIGRCLGCLCCLWSMSGG